MAFLPLELGAPWVVPRFDGSDVERAIAQCNDVISSRARRRLERFLPGLAEQPIWEPGRPEAPMLWRANLEATALGGRAIVDFLTAHEQVGAERVTFSSSGVPEHRAATSDVVHPRQHPLMSPTKLSGAGLMSAMSRGDSVIFNHADDVHPLLGALADDLGRAFGCQVSINAYLSVGGSDMSGFGGHWDEQDVIALPLVGAKQWEIAEPLAPNALLSAMPQGYSDRVVASTRLEPGDALVIPRGWCHRVTQPERGMSFHITIGLIRPRGPQLLAQLIERLARHGELRADFPLRPEDETAGYWASTLRTVSTEDVNAAAALTLARMGGRPFDEASAAMAFGAGVSEGLWIRPQVPSSLILRSQTSASRSVDDAVELGLNSRAVRVPNDLLDPVLDVFGMGDQTLDTALARLGRSGAVQPRGLLAELSAGGVLTMAWGPPRWLA